MKTLLKVVLGLALALVILASTGYAWASFTVKSKLSRTYEVHDVDFPIPYPTAEASAEESGVPDATADLSVAGGEAGEVPEDAALAAARDRGKHLVESRYACIECHGANFGGGTMIDAPPIGRILGPNITRGEGSRTLAYTTADWDHIVRHGIKPDGTPAAMPSVDFLLMSDQELSDIVAYVTSVPPVDNTVPAPTLGPLGKLLIATDQLPLSADVIGSHQSEHAAYPPAAAASAEFGRHLAGICTGCHGSAFAGGPVPGGDPSWPPARNLTPHEDGLAEWTYDDFVRALREAKRPDGTDIRMPMAGMTQYAANMTDTEIEALWAYLRTVPPMASGS